MSGSGSPTLFPTLFVLQMSWRGRSSTASRRFRTRRRRSGRRRKRLLPNAKPEVRENILPRLDSRLSLFLLDHFEVFLSGFNLKNSAFDILNLGSLRPHHNRSDGLDPQCRSELSQLVSKLVHAKFCQLRTLIFFKSSFFLPV
jgi:hypothetical protein